MFSIILNWWDGGDTQFWLELNSIGEENQNCDGDTTGQEEKVHEASTEGLVDLLAFESEFDRDTEHIKFRDEIVVENLFV